MNQITVTAVGRKETHRGVGGEGEGVQKQIYGLVEGRTTSHLLPHFYPVSRYNSHSHSFHLSQNCNIFSYFLKVELLPESKGNIVAYR